MFKAGREKGFQINKEWIAGVRNHLYWAASTTKAGFEDMIEAKWRSFMRHGKYFSKFDILHGSISKLNFCIGIDQILVMWGMSIPIL